MKSLKFKHVLNIALLMFVALMLLNPNAKAWVSQQLMKVGLFKPKLEKPAESSTTEVDAAAAFASEDEQIKVSNNTPVLFGDSQGNQYDAANLPGKVVFINFWATWCAPCIAEMPSIDKLYQSYKDNDDIVFLIVDVDNKIVKSEEFMVKRKLGLPVHVPLGEIPKHWLGSSIPTTVILDKYGQIATRHEGMADYNSTEVREFIQALIDE